MWRLAAALAAALVIGGVVGGVWLNRRTAFDAPRQFHAQKGELVGVQATAAGGDSLYEAVSLELHSSAGYRVRGHLRTPRRDGEWPGLIVIGGVNTGRMAAELINPDDPYVILGLDYPWEGETRVSALEFLLNILAVRDAMLLTPSAVMLAIDYLETRPDVAEGGPVLVGASFGAQLIIVAAALDPRSGPVLAIYGGGDLATLIDANLDFGPGFLRRAVAGIGAGLLEPVEPTRYAAQIAPRPLILINGERDDRVPLASVEALYHAAREPKRLVWLPEGHISSRNPAMLERVLQAAVEALAEFGARPDPLAPADDGRSEGAETTAPF